jgi:hypothetical protein
MPNLQVGEGVRSTVQGAENIVTSSINMVQNQVQNFIQGISRFITNAGETLNRRVSQFTSPSSSDSSFQQHPFKKQVFYY